MADTDKNIEALEAEAVSEANAKNPMADAPKKNAVAAEPSHIAKMNNAITPTGDVMLNTKNFTNGDNYTIIVEFR